MGRSAELTTRMAHGRDGQGARTSVHADHRRRPAHQVSNPLPRHRCRSRARSSSSAVSPFEFATLLTPYFDRVARGGFGASAGPSGTAAWFAAVLLGAVFLGVGAARLAGLLADVRRDAVASPVVMPTRNANEPVMALNIDVGDGRPIPKLVVGQFGAAVIRDLPDASVARHQGPYWEGLSDQGWIRIESPLDRAARDAERVRRWFARDDRDYVVRVYAAVVTADGALPRTPTCAVISESQLEPWLRSLPVQRSLSEARRAQLLAMLRGRRQADW